MRKHPAKYKAAGISPARLREMEGMCAQYRDWQKQLRMARAGIVDRPTRGSEAWHRPDPTGNAAISLAEHPAARKIRLIEECADAVAEQTVARAILRSVADGARYAVLRPPCGERQFYGARQAFFIELDRRLTEMEWRC